jgi:benzoyl-CoA reductase subunit D
VVESLLTAGVDAGSSAVKVAVVRSRAGEDARVLATVIQRIRRRNVHDVAQSALAEACTAAGVAEGDFAYLASTGDGDAVPVRTGHFYSMTAHARGALFLCPDATAVLDVGALHARAIRMDGRGKVLQHRMTSQCASGSGQFLENIARYLGVALEDVGALSRTARKPEAVSSICAVLAETDVINMVSRGLQTADILRGIHDSIAGRLARLVRATGAVGAVVVTGGLALDEGLMESLGHQLDSARGPSAVAPLRAETHPQAIFAGALGAALLAAYRYDQLERMGRLPGHSQATTAS